MHQHINHAEEADIDDDDDLEKMLNTVLLSETEVQELMSTAMSIFEDLILSDPMLYAKQDYKDIILDETRNLLEVQFDNITNPDNKICISDSLSDILDDALYVYQRFMTPKREYGNTFIRKRPCRKKMQRKVDYLSNVPQPEQRTDEWYKFRYKYLTASSLWKVFSTPGSRNQLIYDKCKPLDTSKYKGFSTSSPMHWGHKYEPVSIFWYEHTFHTKVSDFGCIPHKSIEYIAASPDGINTCPLSDRFGRMLEVKNIVNRDITGIPKSEYWIQMQIQMEVCELNECDFLETRFIEYESEEDFNKDGTFQYTEDGKYKGIILFFLNGDEALYEYAPFMCTKEEYEKWEEEIMHKNQHLSWLQNIYWKLEEISCVLVLRNKTWFRGARPVLDEFWEIIQKEKKGDYIHRAPKKRIKNTLSPVVVPSKCMINIDTLCLSNTVVSPNNTSNTIDTSSTTGDNNATKIINIST